MAGQVLYVDKRNAADPVEMYSQAGKVGPAYCTGVGKAMLAHLPETDLAPVLQRQAWHRFTAKTITTADAMRTELAAYPRARPCLRRRGTRARDHLHRRADPHPRGPRAGRGVGHIDHRAHGS
jgi:DNA-binding IclR family transcriptional regulator